MDRGQVLALLALLAIATTACAKTGYGPGEQDWGFVDVRTGAHMFYWLYYTTANVTNYTDRPLVIWLQGGPGESSTGYGNFEELGPLDLQGNHRNWTWVKDVNVLFIDNPVGTGFSYVDDLKYLPLNNNEVALDLVEFMKGFYNTHPEFVNVSLHIFGEGYGGKMASEFALELYYAIQRDEIKSNLTSVTLGVPWISPIDSVLAWAPFLLNMGIVDQDGFNKIMVSANETLKWVQNKNWIRSTALWSATHSVLLRESKGVDNYYVLKPTRGDRYTRMLLWGNNHSRRDLMNSTLVPYDIENDPELKLQTLMRGPVSKALAIPSNIIWGSQRREILLNQVGDFMKPVIHIVRDILGTTDLKVSVFSAQLDLICATAGTVNWIEKMQWSYRDEYVMAPRLGIIVDRILEGYEKSAGNFTMFWIDRSGHRVPADNPAAMSYILKKLTNYD